MPNHLINSNSPYLLQHANNPVDWYPWGEEALEKAKEENKPIFLSVGYAACHWCHVMAHESFENDAIAAIMNRHFINIKVDREERPDIDHIYMQAVVALTHQGGWPMSVFMTPDGEPFYGGTYFPPVRRYNMPAFREILETIAHLWQEDRQQLLQNAENITQHLRSNAQIATETTPITPRVVEEAVQTLSKNYDWRHGGWGQAPKFPQPMIIDFLLQLATREDQKAREMAQHVLQAMAKGGMYDVVGGGFARYSVDNQWKVPHFEKMLYDNAQLARVYLHAYLITGNPFFQRVCESTLDFVLREMTHPEGGFYSSLDADSEGVEGKFYVWSLDQIRDLNFEHPDEEILIAAYGISESGNFEGANVLQRVLNDEEIADKFNLNPKDVPQKLDVLHARLLQARSQRVRPATDDKILTAWNALMLLSFAEAGRYLQQTKYTKAAIRNATFLIQNLINDDTLYRSWRAGTANHNAYLEDYASLILALLAVYQSDPDPNWYAQALRFGQEMVSKFQDTDGGFFDTPAGHEKLLLRPKDIQDNATPSGSALAALALLQLSSLSGNTQWRDRAENALENITQVAARYPTGFAQWLCAIDFAIGPGQEVAILGEQDSVEFQALQETLWEGYRPRLVAALSSFPPASRSPELLLNRPLLNQKPTAYVCQNFVCHQPVNSPKDLKEQLEKP